MLIVGQFTRFDTWDWPLQVEGAGMVVVEKKGTTWQDLNQHYSIWEVAGHGAAIGNMLTLFLLVQNIVVVQLVRALVNSCGLGFNSCVVQFFFLLLLLLDII